MLQSLRIKASGKLVSVPRFFQFPDRFKGGRIEKWKNYWNGVGRDYKEAAEEMITSAKQSPVRSTIILGLTGFAGYCNKTNPTLEEYRTHFVENNLDLLQVSDSIRNRNSVNLQNYISKAFNAHLIRRNNYGLFSIIWVDDFAPELGGFAARCEYIQPGFTDLRSRLVDIGFLGRFWISSRKMVDFDVNIEEWDSGTGMPLQPNTQLKQMW